MNNLNNQKSVGACTLKTINTEKPVLNRIFVYKTSSIKGGRFNSCKIIGLISELSLRHMVQGLNNLMVFKTKSGYWMIV